MRKLRCPTKASLLSDHQKNLDEKVFDTFDSNKYFADIAKE
jgi:hypothetical protein